MTGSNRPPARYWLRKFLPKLLLALAPGATIGAVGYVASRLSWPWNVAAVAAFAVLIVIGALVVHEIGYYREMRRLGAFDRDGNRISR